MTSALTYPSRRKFSQFLVGTFMALALASQALAEEGRVLVQSTTSTLNSGLYDYILPHFQAAAGLRVDVVAVGTGQAIRNAMNGDADVLLVHAKASEEKFVAEGYGVERFDLMYNDFVLIGPASDPAGLAAAGDLNAALAALAGSNVAFVSRGDDSGTHKKERALWKTAGLAVDSSQSWYRETGAGMGATIRAAIEMNGYALTDRATWLAYDNKMDHVIAFAGDPAMFNQYGVIAVNPERFSHVNKAGADAFIAWLLSAEGQALIASYRQGGEQLFFPNASR